MLVYVVRHGQSLSNKSGVRNGQTDVPLTEQGYEDARRGGEKLKGIVFDRVFSSDLIRATETAKTALPGCNPETTPLIREVHIGSLAGQTGQYWTDFYGESYIRNNQELNYVPYGGENSDIVYARVSEFMKKLENLSDCNNVAVFSHAGAIYFMLQYVLGVRFPRGKISLGNACVTVFEFKEGNWRLMGFNN